MTPMPIPFARSEIVHAARDSSAQGLSAYISRGRRRDRFTGASFSFVQKFGDLVHHEVSLPNDAPLRFLDPSTLWDEATLRETTLDRKTLRVRFKRNAQVAKHIIIALPKECSDAERLEITRRFVVNNFTRFGVAVEWAIHRPDDDSTNHHCHLLVTSRLVKPTGLTKKARALNPGFATNSKGQRFVADQDYLTDRWVRAQNEFFDELGLDLRVDPKRQMPGVHVGPSWHSIDATKRAKSNAADTAAETLMEDPAAVLKGITVGVPTFTVRDLEKYVQKHGLKGEARDNAVKAALAQHEIIRLTDPQGRDLFTTKSVRAHEFKIIELAKRISRSRPLLPVDLVAAAAKRYTLDTEQANAVRFLAGGGGLRVLIGRAGTGKTRVLSAAREVFEQSKSNISVRGLAPTNAAALTLKDDGFGSAMTVHRALHRLKRGTERWDQNTAVFLDEAGLLDAETYEQLLQAVTDSGAALILSGDDRQLGSVRRGGIFSEIKKRFGSIELRRVRRQDMDWQREASQDFARGNAEAGLQAYSQRGFLQWASTLDESRSRLVADWFSEPDGTPRFVYASTNVEVDRINAEIKATRRERGEIAAGVAFKTVRGDVELSAGDRLQFYANDRANGIVNGLIGTVKSVEPRRVEVITDGGATIAFDPECFASWGLGYAGTIYRSQGKTQIRVLALFDNQYAWDARVAYVAMTRHKAEVQLYASRDITANEGSLARAMSRSREDSASIAYEIFEAPKHPVDEGTAELTELRRMMGLSDSPDAREWDTPLLTSAGRSKRKAYPSPSPIKQPGRTVR